MAKTKKINGETYRITLSGNVSGKKTTATKTAEKMRELGYNARVIKQNIVSGRTKNEKGVTIKKFKTTRYDVYIK
jgi:uncharacterized NAD-dependent epimerase/dehydratase family protein